MILCDGSGIGWRHASFGVDCRIPLRQLGRRVVQGAAQVGQQPQPGGGHGEPAPAGRGAVEHRPDQGQAGVLAGQAADDLDPAAGLAEGAFDEVRSGAPGSSARAETAGRPSASRDR